MTNLFKFLQYSDEDKSEKVANEQELISAFRRKYVLTLLILISMVLGVMFFIVLAFNYSNQISYIDNSLSAAFKNPNTSGRINVVLGGPVQAISGGEGPTFKEPVEETLIQNMVPVYIVRTDLLGGKILTESNPSIKMYSEKFEQNAIIEAIQSPYYSGYLPEQDLFYALTETQEGYRIGFADGKPIMESMRNLTLAGLLFISLTLIFFTFIALWLSKLAVSPIKEAWETQKRFVADASHELKTPLTVILANTDIILRNEDRTVGEQKKWLLSTREEALSMQNLVQDLLTLSRLQSQGMQSPDKLTSSFSAVNFSEICEKQILQFESLAFEKGVTLEELVESGVELLGNEDELERLLKILIDNAIKYANAGGYVRVTLKNQAQTYKLTVNNTGDPISKEDLQNIFRRFYRSDSSRHRQTGGYGLGLAIAHGIVVKHGGSISASSDEEHGTTFHVEFPKNLSEKE